METQYGPLLNPTRSTEHLRDVDDVFPVVKSAWWIKHRNANDVSQFVKITIDEWKNA